MRESNTLGNRYPPVGALAYRRGKARASDLPPQLQCNYQLNWWSSQCDCFQNLAYNKGPIGASFCHLITEPACGWLQNQLNGDCLYPSRPTQPNISPFRVQTDLVALSAISAFQSLNKHSPLVAHFKIGCMNSAYTLQDQLSQISAHLDWFGRSKCHFCTSVTK